ncbi:MAG: ComF family protein [Gallionellaceae bacterium]|nr:ComF family protein [Gallionellaceae bacterium]
MSILTASFLNIRTKLWRMFPAQPCFLCGAASDEIWCSACDADLPYLTLPHCPVCALPTLSGETCGRCLQKQPQFDRTVAVFAYTFPLDKLIQALKFGEQLVLVNRLADKLAQRADNKSHIQPDYIIPMPLHPARLRERGFNLSQELARRVGKKLGIPVLSNACQRVRDTPPQSSLRWQERSKNMRRAFSCSSNLTGKHIAVVDDVMTSGASLNE